jgi:hypothetical protein
MRTSDGHSLFADQFEPDGKGGYLYRKNMRGPAISVTAGERDGFMDDFARSRRFLQRVLAVGILLAIVALVSVSSWLRRDLTDGAIFPLTVAAVAIFMLAWHRIWGAPAAALEWRTPAGPALSRTAARRLAIERVSWAHLGLAALLIPFSIFRATAARDPFVHWFWIALAIFFAAGLPLQAFRKWRVERETRMPSD